MAQEAPRGVDPAVVRAEVREDMRLEAVIDQAEAQYPFLAEESPDFDAELVGEVLDVYRGLLLREQPKDGAMARALSYVLGASGRAPASPASPASPPAPDRRKTDVAKNLAAARSQPPELGDRGYNSDRAGPSKVADVAHMSIEEYERSFSRSDEDKFLK